MEATHRYANKAQVEAVYDLLDRPSSFNKIRDRLRMTDTQCDSALKALQAQGRVHAKALGCRPRTNMVYMRRW